MLGQGKFKTPEELKAKAALRGGRPPTEKDIQICQVLQEVADEIGGGVHLAHSESSRTDMRRPLTPVGLAWARQMMTDCVPVLGGTSIEQLKSNIAALKIVLTEQQMTKLNDAAPFFHGYPTGHFGLDPRLLPGQQPETSFLNRVSLQLQMRSVRLTDQAGHVKYPRWP